MVAHRFWLSQDLVTQVCWLLLRSWPETNGDLVAVARCCRDTFYPAIDCIWRDLQDLEPLLNLLRCNENYELVPIGRPDHHGPKAWTTMERYEVYCGCIRALRGVGWYDPTINWLVQIPMETLRFVAYGRSSTTLLTALRWLEWNTNTLTGLSIFWGPTVTTLSVAIAPKKGEDDPPVAWLSSAIQQAAAPELLQRLVLHGPVVAHAHVPLFVQAFHRLVVLQLPLHMVSAETVRHLVTLPALVDLRFNLIRFRLRAVSRRPGFLSLDRVELNAPSRTAMEFLGALPAEDIREIEWIFPTYDAAGHSVAHEYGSTAEMLLSRGAAGLRVLRLIQRADDVVFRIRPHVDFLQPLLRMRRLEDVEIHIDLGDLDLRLEMARAFSAWPKLRRFRIATYGGHLALDMQSVLKAAAACSDLRELHLPVGIRWGPPHGDLKEAVGARGRHVLHTLRLDILRADRVALSDEDDGEQLAKLTRWLEPSFPHLALVELRWPTYLGRPMNLVRAVEISDSATTWPEADRVGQWEARRLGLAHE